MDYGKGKIELLEKAEELFLKLQLTSLRLKDDNLAFEIEIKKEQPATLVGMPASATSTEVSSTSDLPSEVVAESVPSGLHAISAPLVGVFYAAPSPEQPAFVKVGDHVKKGDVICIIEAMKMMNEITADCDCTIREVCATNGKLVEFGQMLFKVKED